MDGNGRTGRALTHMVLTVREPRGGFIGTSHVDVVAGSAEKQIRCHSRGRKPWG
jgi:hypothetical protein